MTLCEHGCGTELDVRVSAERAVPYEQVVRVVHTDARCRDATRALLDEARRELEVDSVQIKQLENLVNTNALAAANARVERFRAALDVVAKHDTGDPDCGVGCVEELVHNARSAIAQEATVTVDATSKSIVDDVRSSSGSKIVLSANEALEQLRDHSEVLSPAEVSATAAAGLMATAAGTDCDDVVDALVHLVHLCESPGFSTLCKPDDVCRLAAGVGRVALAKIGRAP